MQILQGEDVRTLAAMLMQNGQGIPKAIIRFMYEAWINPTSHKFLMEGDFRRFTRNSKVMYYEKLKSSEVSYLIKRFGNISRVNTLQEENELAIINN